MKKTASVLIAVIMVLSSLQVFAANPTVTTKSDAEVTNVIKLLEIANGDQNGNMNYDSKVTRAEFVKMAVNASTAKDDATDKKLNVSLFTDVKNSYWGAGYISVGVSTGLINGYLDGSFRPNNEVKLEEAATIVLKLLGYTSSDFISPYPSAQMDKYRVLDLDSGINAKQGESLTRRECMQLIYNTLSTKAKDGTVYCTKLGYAVASDGIIDYNALVEKKLSGPFIVENGNYKNLISFEASSATVYRDGKAASAQSISDYDTIYYIDKIKTIWAYTDKVFGKVDTLSPNSINPTGVTVSGKLYSIASSGFADSAVLTKDSYVMLIMDKNGLVCGARKADSQMYAKYHDPDADYLDTLSTSVSDPFVVTDAETWKSKVSFIVSDDTIILLDGYKISASQIKAGDIIYASAAFNTLLIYRKTATGICTAVTSIDNIPQSITVSQKTYMLATNSVKDKFAVGGSLSAEKAFVTLLLGKDDEAVDAIAGDLTKLTANKDNPTYLQMVEETISTPILVDSKENLNNWKTSVPFDVSKASVFLNGVESTTSAVKYNDVVYYSEQFNTIWVFRDTQSGVISAVTANNIVLGGNSYTLATDSAKYKVSTYGPYSKDDYVTLILGKDDEVVDIYSANTDNIGNNENDGTYAEIVSATLKGPYIVDSNLKLANVPFEISGAKIYKGSNSIAVSDIKAYDVYYYSDILKTIWIYRETASGTIESILPVSAPTSVVLSGKSFSIESSQASYDLSSFGTYHVGDTATFLLGKDGAVAGVVNPSVSSGVVYGVVTDEGTKIFTKSDGTTYTADYVTVTSTDCTKFTYEFENKYLSNGDVVRVVVGDSIKISKQSTNIATGTASILKNAIYDGRFSKDCEIIDVYGSNVKRIYPSRLTGMDIDLDEFTLSGIVKYYELDKDNCISKLIFHDFTGDVHEYGVVTASNEGFTKYMIESTVMNYTSSSSTYTDGPACFKSSDGTSVDVISPMRSYFDVKDLTKNAAFNDSNKEYKLAENVKVYIKNTASYTYSDIDEVLSGNYEYRAYYDKTPVRGGLVRVIIATKAY